jgi:hypothetical protein
VEKETKAKKTIPKLKDEDYTFGAYIVIGVILLVIVGIILFIFKAFPFNSSGVVTCNSQSCFEKQFSLCQPTTWVAANLSENITIKYKINQKVGSLCEVQFSTSTASNITVACNFNNSVTFAAAQNLAEKDPKPYDCRKL